MQAIPMIRAKYITAILEVAARRRVCVDDLRRKAGIPGQLPDSGDAFVPSWQFHELLGWAVRLSDRSFEVVPEMIEAVIGSDPNLLSRLTRNSSTILNAFSSLQATVSSEFMPLRLKVNRQGDSVRVSVSPKPHTGARGVATEICELAILCRMIRIFAGSEWSPKRVWLRAQADSRIEELRLLAHSKVHFRAPETTVLLPESVLRLQFPTVRVSPPAPLGEPPSSFEESLQQVIASALGGGVVQIETVAKLLRMSVRTLQRRLAANSVSFSELVDRTRFWVSTELLQVEELKLLDIAHATGYSDHAHFTRAFRRITGVTPSDFRQRIPRRPGVDWRSGQVNSLNPVITAPPTLPTQVTS